MKSIKIFTHVVGTIACAIGLAIAFIFLFPGYAMELGMEDANLKSLFVSFIIWMGLFAVSLHMYTDETRSK